VTLLHLIGTLDKPTTGTVRVTGLDVAVALLGGAAGVGAGVLATAIYAHARGRRR
jgi:ABC-type Na+ transport system ATPase subunit NatA